MTIKLICKNMNSLEFTTKIERGVIHFPKEFEEYEKSYDTEKYQKESQ